MSSVMNHYYVGCFEDPEYEKHPVYGRVLKVNLFYLFENMIRNFINLISLLKKIVQKNGQIRDDNNFLLIVDNFTVNLTSFVLKSLVNLTKKLSVFLEC
jgi:hypothetical protein